MTKDLAPELIDDAAAGAATLSMEDAASLPDTKAQPGPEDFVDIKSVSPEQRAELDPVHWPSDDAYAPDYAYVASESEAESFTLAPDVLEALISVNRYEPNRQEGVMAFALRGAVLRSGYDVEKADNVDLEVVRPDHRNYLCIIGYYFIQEKKLSVYTGSTVPCRRAIYNYVNGGQRSNMLPTGMHTFYVWRHKSIKPALRMGKSQHDPEAAAWATVLRNKNNYQIEVSDLFDYSDPLDNVHCSYYLDEDEYLGASFSSWGCLTVRGASQPSDQWKKFQEVLKRLGQRTRVDLLLATGKDAALAAAFVATPEVLSDKLTSLRVGSRGLEVARLQQKLGIEASGYYGAVTLDRFTAAQRRYNDDCGHGRVADGIFTPVLDNALGWQVFARNLGTAHTDAAIAKADVLSSWSGPSQYAGRSNWPIPDSANDPARGFSYLQERTFLERLERIPKNILGRDLPISRRQATEVTKWLKGNFGTEIEAATAGSPFPPAVLCAMVCQETAYRFVHKIGSMSPADILARCVLDGSGDVPGAPRKAYPRNTPIFRNDYGDEFTDMLIAEGNKMRADLKGWSPVNWMYKGYGIFQYDLQFVKSDEAYFRELRWYEMSVCLERVRMELDRTYAKYGELWEAIRAYNGSGSAAYQYKRNVKAFYNWCEPAWEQTTVPTS